MTRCLLSCLLTLLLIAPARAQFEEPLSADPLVALDTAKHVLGDGRLEEAQRQFAQIHGTPAEPYIDEEVALQRMLLDGAFLDATHQLISQLYRMEQGQGRYSAWLHMKRDEYAGNFASHARRYLELTQGGAHLTFVRFRLPHVSVEHLNDVVLYGDPQVLAAATKNWDEGREGLGKGLILAQARVAVALNAATFYDMHEGKTTIADVSRRLMSGVPLSHLQVLDWIADTGLRLKAAGNGLEQLSRGVDDRLLTLSATIPAPHLVQRANERRNPPAPVAAPSAAEKKPAAKKQPAAGKRRR